MIYNYMIYIYIYNNIYNDDDNNDNKYIYINIMTYDMRYVLSGVGYSSRIMTLSMTLNIKCRTSVAARSLVGGPLISLMSWLVPVPR